MNPLSFIFFILAGIVIGFINVTGGGGALVTTPLLLALGVNPYIAVATNKFVPIGGFITGGTKYYNAKVLTKNKLLLLMAIFASASAILGANLILTINATILNIRFLLLLLLFSS
jgi:uncharacterized membrane protein YfcA